MCGTYPSGLFYNLAINLKRVDDQFRMKGQKLFKFEAMWVEYEACKKVIETAWMGVIGPLNIETVMKKIQSCGEKLMVWNKSSFGNVKRNIEKVRNRHKGLHNSDVNGISYEEIRKARDDMQK